MARLPGGRKKHEETIFFPLSIPCRNVLDHSVKRQSDGHEFGELLSDIDDDEELRLVFVFMNLHAAVGDCFHFSTLKTHSKNGVFPCSVIFQQE